MQKSKFQFKIQSLINPANIILVAVVLRLIPHPPNFAPIAAMALFGGVYLSKKYAIMIPLIAMFSSDIFLGFHESMITVYSSFLITGLIGLWLKKYKTPGFVLSASLISSLIFYILTNFNYWYSASLYPKTIDGLMMSYFNALPFFRNSIIGDLFYVALFFGAYGFALKLKTQKLIINISAQK